MLFAPLLLLGWSIYRFTVSEAGRKALEHVARLRADAFDHLRNVECSVGHAHPDDPASHQRTHIER
jgi:hypothetical protein